MKTFLTTAFAILLFTVTCRAQWTAGTGYAYLTTSTDKVGIGTGSTITPGLKVHIIGALGFPVTTGTTQTGVLRLQGTGSNAVLDFGVNSASGAALQVTNQIDLSQTYPLLLNPNGGSVGIGASPNFASGTGLEIQQAGPVTFRMENSTGAKSMELRQTATYFSLFNINAQHTVLAENGGNVGIGTATPTTGKLVIDANTAAPSVVLHINNSAGGAGNNGAVTFGGSGSSAGAYGFIDYNPSSAYGIRYSALGPLVFGSNTNAGYGTSTFTEAMRVAASGNVGIGTTAPANKLHIVDVTGTNTLNLQLSTNTLNETIGIAFGTLPGNRTKASITGVNTNAGNSAGALAFYTSSGTSLNEAMRINSVGNVGIGSSTPASQLHVYENSTGNNSATGITLEQGGTGNALLQFLQTGVQRWTMGIDNSTAGGQSFKIAAGIGLGTADKLTVLTSGNVGIGTNSPGVKTQITGLLGFPANAGGTQTGILRLQGTGSNGVLDFSVNGGSGAALQATSQIDLSQNYTLSLNPNGGNVGIGTTSPDQKLTVNGTVHSSQVIVDTNIPTPDYVFDKTYDLPTLSTVKTYIDKNHHLPEMPSAAEFAKNGQNLGDMNTLLLKKVEELTLYLIANEKKMKEQDERIQKLEKDLKNK